MYKWGIGAAAAALAMPFAGGQADAQQWYGSAAISLSDLDTAETTIRNQFGPGVPLNLNADADEGYGGRLAVGVVSGAVRVEGEFGYAWNDFAKYRSTSPPSASSLPLSGRVRTTSFMANGFLDFDLGGAPVQPFIGAGVGIANVDIEATGPLPTAPTGPQVALLDDDETDLAYQAMAGVSIPLGDRFALTAQYRWFNAGSVEGTNPSGHSYRSDIVSSNMEVGARLKF